MVQGGYRMKPIDKLRVQKSIMGENWLPGIDKKCLRCEWHLKEKIGHLCIIRNNGNFTINELSGCNNWLLKKQAD